MTAVWRLNLVVLLVFALATVITIYVMLAQASRDIEREVSASVDATLNLLTPPRDAVLEALKASPLRHVHLEVLPAEQPAPRATALPGIAGLLTPSLDERFVTHSVGKSDGETVHIVPDPIDEWDEVLESVYFVLALFAVTALMSCTAIWLAVSRGLRPVQDILHALREVGQRHFNARLGRYAVPEINTIAEKFNSMAGDLELSDKENTLLMDALLTLTERERTHLARELHDDLGQYLTGIRSQAFALAASCNEDGQQAATKLISHCGDMQTGFRRLINQLHPVVLEIAGLEDALRQLVENWSETRELQCEVDFAAEMPDFDIDAQAHVYRIVQEALTNVDKHAPDATRLRVSSARAADGLWRLQVQDNGRDKGLAPEQGGIGIRSMRERARLISAELTTKQDHNGFSVTLIWPKEEDNAHVSGGR